MLKRILNTSLLVAFILSALLSVSAQRMQYGVLYFEPPKGWEMETDDGSVTYSKTNETSKTFGSIMISTTFKSKGSPAKDHDPAWLNIANSGLLSSSYPKQESDLGGGWTGISNNFLFNEEGVSFAGIYITLSNSKDTLNILFKSNYDIRDIISKFTKSFSFTNSVSNESSGSDAETTPAKKPGFWQKLGAAIEEAAKDVAEEKKAKKAGRENTNGSSSSESSDNNDGYSIVGNWSRNGASIASYVNRSNGSYIGDASMSSDVQYIFKANGTYEYYRIFLSSGSSVLIAKEGTYSISGDSITLRPTKSSAAYPPGWQLIRDNYLSVETFKVFIGPTPYTGYPQNCLHFSNNDGSNYPWDIFKLSN